MTLSDKLIPERWLPIYTACLTMDFDYPGLLYAQKLIEELGSAEAALYEARQERDRQYEFNIRQIATQAALEQQLSEARRNDAG